MEQEGEETREEKRQPQRAAQQQQKCPRCDSMNTKFCYFNNYSLSQPRHFCKTCKRYWTHGGTFRNIPVGGGFRKGKRDKTNSSSSNSLTQLLQNLLRPSPPLTNMVHSTSPYYNHLGGGGSGYLPSLPTLHSLNTSQPFNQYLKVGGDVAGSSSTPLVSGFNAAYNSLPPPFLQSMYPAQQRLLPSNMAGGSAASHSSLCPQSLMNNVSLSSTSHRASSDASLWSATSISGNPDQNNVKGVSSSSLTPNHWLHRPGFDHPQ